MIKFYWAKDALWYSNTTRGETVSYFFRIGVTEKSFLKIYDIIIWKLRIAYARVK